MTYATVLSHRGILRLSGSDRASFLQGLVTNDVNKISLERGIYTAFLTPQGKFQHDLFITAHLNDQNEEVWLIDCERDRADILLKRLSLYKLRSHVTLENISGQFSVLGIWNLDHEFLEVDFSNSLGAVKNIDQGMILLDPRLKEMGARVIIPSDQVDAFCHDYKMSQKPFEDYDDHRLLWGVPDGGRDILIDRGIILESGFEELNAMDWDKGCYMGQELMARTHHRGLIRKRLMPVTIEGGTPSFQAPIVQGGVEVGEMRSTLRDKGIALIRLEALKKNDPFYCENVLLHPYVPEWMKLPVFSEAE